MGEQATCSLFTFRPRREVPVSSSSCSPSLIVHVTYFSSKIACGPPDSMSVGALINIFCEKMADNCGPPPQMECTDNDLHYLSDERGILAFRIPETVEKENEEVEDDEFYDLTLNEVKRIYKHLQDSRMELEEAPLLTKKKREELENERAVTHTSAVVRVEFPDRTVLQGVFSPSDSIATLTEVIGHYLRHPGPFTLFTAPPKTVLSDESSLQAAGLVPTGKIYFKSGEAFDEVEPYLKDEVLQQLSSHQAASQAAAVTRSKDKKKEKKEISSVDEAARPVKGSHPAKSGAKGPASLLKFLSKPSVSSTSSTFRPS